MEMYIFPGLGRVFYTRCKLNLWAGRSSLQIARGETADAGDRSIVRHNVPRPDLNGMIIWRNKPLFIFHSRLMEFMGFH